MDKKTQEQINRLRGVAFAYKTKEEQLAYLKGVDDGLVVGKSILKYV